MKLYRFSPIISKEALLQAITHIHRESYRLCKQSLGQYLPNAGNVGIFCHYDDEYNMLTKLRQELTVESGNINQKYFKLHQPVVVASDGDIPEAIYEYLYIRKPDPYRFHVGDIDFYLADEHYQKLKLELQANVEAIKGARIFDRPDLDMIELYDSDSDVLAYISTTYMTDLVRVKQSNSI